MWGNNTERVRRLAGVGMTGLAALLIVACAASSTVPTPASVQGAIADVVVESEAEATTVMLMGLSEPVFTAFAQQNPERVVVDVASAQPSMDLEPMLVQDGLVDEVTLAPYETAGGQPMTRVEVALLASADYDVVPTSEGLMIRVSAMQESAENEGDGETAAFDPWAPNEMDESAEEPAAPVASTPATTLTGVEVREAGEGSLIHLVADGTVSSAESFTLENPDRLVIDLPGMKSGMDRDKVQAGTEQASQVRIGQHADMVRVVIDGGSSEEPFASRRVTPAATGLVIALGSGEELAWAAEAAAGSMPPAAMPEPEMEMAAEDASVPEAGMDESMADDWTDAGEPMAEASEPADMGEEMEMADTWEAPAETEPVQEMSQPEAMPEPEVAETPAVIYGVEYDAQADRDRVVIMSESPADYILFEPAPDTVVVSFQNATIDPAAAVRITPQPNGPLSLVSAFEQPETGGTEVRVVMKRADGLKPEISRRGSIVVVDFPRDGSIAATPPVMESEPMQPASTPAPAAEPAYAAAPESDIPVRQPEQTMPIARAPELSAAQAPAAQAPAAIGSQPAIEVLQEGGLIDGKEYLGRRISLDFKDIDMADVLRLIAEVSDLNVIAGEEVKGKVTIRLVDVPWDQALDVILLTKGLGFMRVGNVLRIAPADVLQSEEELRLQERRALEQLEDLIVKLQPVNYADSTDMKGMVSRLLTARGTVDVDKRTNTLIIKDIPSVIDEATALVKAIDTQTPQVLIESKIVEANLDFSREFGVSWGVGAQPLVDAFDTGSGPRTDLGSGDFRLNTTESGFGNNAGFFNPLTANPTSLFNIAGFLLDEKINLNLQLQAAEVNGDGKVISSPRVVTLDNSKATIEQGVSIPFQTFENGDAQLEFVDAVLKLDVTPHITADRSIIMDVKVSRNAPDDSVFTLTGSPAIAKNQVDTETLVKDGQTLVIGGIYVIDKSSRQSRVPYLHSVPIIGTLFRNDEVSDARKELLIFVTPRVVEAQQGAAN